MENFLASRPIVSKLGSTVKNLSGGAFAPLLAKQPDVPPTSAAATAKPPATHPGGAAESAHAHQVRVEVVRENGVATSVVVICKCGERIELECLY